ncbi:MAG TPA: lipid II flippase MurJ [Ramlibacter sp.]|nr:lipid II flippase MurJ [Ramlibacter sp.]
MLLRAGAVSLALLLVSRLLGLVRESVQAAAFGATGLGDVSVLMLSLPDWVAGVLATGGLAYVLLPAWAKQGNAEVATSQRRVARGLLLAGCTLAGALALLHPLAVQLLLGGLPPELVPAAGDAMLWAAVGLPLALLAALWSTRLQHEGDFGGLYGANLVVNLAVIGALWLVARQGTPPAPVAVQVLGAGLLAALALRLAWLHLRQRPFATVPSQARASALPRASVWVWAVTAAGLPLALPFVARSLASRDGPGALAVFNYGWKLAELPLLLAVQLVATLALGPIARAVSQAGNSEQAATTVRRGFAVAWALACGSAAGLAVAADALSRVLFGWGRMQPEALAQVAALGRIAAWGLLPQALTAIALAVLATQARLRPAVLGYALGLALLLLLHPESSEALMHWLNLVFGLVALIVLAALADGLHDWLPWRALLAGLLGLLAVHGALELQGAPAAPLPQLAAGALAGLLVLVLAWAASPDLRTVLRR